MKSRRYNDHPHRSVQCPGCEGVLFCAPACLVKRHPRPAIFDPPASARGHSAGGPKSAFRFVEVVARDGELEVLACGHRVDPAAQRLKPSTGFRACFECGRAPPPSPPAPPPDRPGP